MINKILNWIKNIFKPQRQNIPVVLHEEVENEYTNKDGKPNVKHTCGSIPDCHHSCYLQEMYSKGNMCSRSGKTIHAGLLFVPQAQFKPSKWVQIGYMDESRR